MDSEKNYPETQSKRVVKRIPCTLLFRAPEYSPQDLAFVTHRPGLENGFTVF